MSSIEFDEMELLNYWAIHWATELLNSKSWSITYTTNSININAPFTRQEAIKLHNPETLWPIKEDVSISDGE